MEILETRLASLTVNGVCELIEKIDDLNPNKIDDYKSLVRDNNINGRVLLHCTLQDLKEVTFNILMELPRRNVAKSPWYFCYSIFLVQVLRMGFGDWELFRMVIVSLREQELSSFTTNDEGSRSVRFSVGHEQIARKGETIFNHISILHIHRDGRHWYLQ